MAVKMLWKLGLVLVVGSLLACNGEADPLGDTGADLPSQLDGGSTTQVVGSAGGTLVFHSGKVKLEVPAGALANDVSIKVLIEKDYPKDSMVVLGTVYDLLPNGTAFKKPVKLSIAYDQADVPTGATEAGLRIYKVISGGWKVVSGGDVDTKVNVAWVSINSFSKYGVKGKPGTPVDASVDAAVPVDGPKPDAPDSSTCPASQAVWGKMTWGGGCVWQ